MKPKLTPEEEAYKIDANKDLHEYFKTVYGLERFHSMFHKGKDANWTNQVNLKGREIPPIYFTLKEREEEILRLNKMVSLLREYGDEQGGLNFIKHLEESKLKKENDALKERNRFLEQMFEKVGGAMGNIEMILELINKGK